MEALEAPSFWILIISHLWRVKFGQVRRPKVVRVADSRDHLRVPAPMHVGPSVEEPNLGGDTPHGLKPGGFSGLLPSNLRGALLRNVSASLPSLSEYR